jgi:putative transposase
MDGSMTKAPLGGERTGPNPTDRARSLLTEGKGVPLGIADEGANHNDFKLSRQTFESIPIERPEPSEAQPQNL